MPPPRPISRRARGVWLALVLLAFIGPHSDAQVPPPDTLTIAPVADVYVDSGFPTTNFDTDARLRARAPAARISYLRFIVTGVGGRPVQQARLRLEVAGAAASGGAIHRITNTTWNAATVTYTTRPAIDGPALATLGAVALGTIVEFTLDTTVTADGTYSVAIDSTSTDGVTYTSSAAITGQPPVLVLIVANTRPTVTIDQPPDGSTFFAGDAITLQGHASDAAGTDVSARIAWHSSLAGPLGTGTVVTATLAQGAHTVTASVTDDRGQSGASQVGLVVTPRPARNTEPLVTITAPTSGHPFAAGVPTTFAATASDLEDGPLSPQIAWTSDRDGPLGTGATFARAFGAGTHQITASVTDSGGLGGTATVLVQVETAVTRLFPAVADAPVDAGFPDTNFGTSPLLRVDANLARIAYTRVVVSGIGARSIVQAMLRLQVDANPGAESASGGTVQTVPGGSWEENTVTFATRPAPNSAVLASVGPVTRGQVVDFDVTPAVDSDGTYDFALTNASSDEATYRSREGGPAPALVLVLAGGAPVVTITDPPTGTVVFAGTPLVFRGDASDPEDGALGAQPAWSSSLDGVLGTGPTITAGALRPGTHTITAAATDADGLTSTAQVAVRVRTPNVAPAVSITAPADGAAAPVGSMLTLHGSAHDEFDGDLGSRLAWSSSRDGALGTGTSVSTSHLRIGTHVLTASVTDSDGAGGAAHVTVTITPTAPTVSISAPAAGTTVFAGTPVTLAATASDAVDGNLSAAIAWSSDRDSSLGSGASVSTNGLSVGTHLLSATVANAAGLTGSASRTLTVRASNTPPVLALRLPADGTTVLTGRPLLVAATAVDAEDGDLGPSITWTSSLDGSLGTGAQRIVPGLSVGTHVLAASVTDRDGAASAQSRLVTVVPATVTVPALADTYVDSGSTSTKFGTAAALLAGTSPVRQAFLRFAVTDTAPFTVDRALLRLTVGANSTDASTAGGTVRAISNTTWSEATTTYSTRPALDGATLATRGAVTARQVVDFDLSAGVRGDATYNFALTSSVSDWVKYASREAAIGQPALLLTLGQNAAPLVTIGAPAAGTRVRPNSPVTFVATALDAESGDLSAHIAWQSDRDGTLGTGASLSVPGLSSGRQTITAQVTDAGGRSGSATLTLDVDYPPAVTITAPADGAAVFAAALPLALRGLATDVEDGDLAPRLEWRSDRDGPLAAGGTIQVVSLSLGTHTIAAAVTDSDGLRTEARITVHVRPPNVPPVVTITAPADGAAVPAGTAITLAAVARDDFDGDVAGQVRWLSSRDNALGTGATRTVTLTEGAHTLTAEATDADGAVGSARLRVTVTPTAPVVTITAPAGGTTIFTGTGLTFAGTALDATDGNLGTALRWVSNRDGLIGTGPSFTTTRLSIGTHIVTASASDAGGLRGQAERTIIVRPPNLPPAITLLTPAAGTTLLAGKPILLGARPSDSEDGELGTTTRWMSSRDGALGTGATLVVIGLSTGTHTLTATATDRDGGATSASVAVSVVPAALAFTPVADTYVDSGSPTTKFGTATTVTAGTSPVRQAFFRFAVAGVGPFTIERALLRLTVGANSGDGSAVGGTIRRITNTTWSESTTTYNTRPAIDGAVLASAAKVVPKAVVDFDLTAGITTDAIYNLALSSASSDWVKYASREASAGKPQLLLTLAQNTAPLVTISTPAPGAVVALGSVVTLRATALDAEGGDLSSQITWRSDRDGALGTGATLAVSTLSPGVHLLSARVTDAGGAVGQALLSLRIDSPPTLAITAPASGSEIPTGAALTLRATAHDADDGDLSAAVTWTSSLDGPLGQGAAIEPGALPPGRHTITATVIDSHGQQASSRMLLIVNTPPTLAIIAPVPGTLVAPGDSVALSATANDLEDGDLGAATAWRSDLDGPLGTGGSVTVTTLRSATHTITATVSDTLDKETRASTTVVVNAPPTLHVTAPADHATFLRGTTIAFTADAVDVEDGPLTPAIVWTSDLEGPLGTGGTVSARLLHAGTHTVTATVTDAGGRTTSARLTLLIDGAPLVVISSPAPGARIVPGAALFLVATASDTEDGSLSAAITWTSDLDGALGTGGTLAVDTLRSGLHTLTAAVTDANGATASDHVSVLVNAPPVVTVTAPADGALFAPGDTITLTASASDTEDGDLGTLIAWASDRDGALGPGATISTTQLRSGTHTVTAAVSDTRGATTSAQLTLIVNAAPTVVIVTPAAGTVVAPGNPVLLAAVALDTEDGDLGPTVAWTADEVMPLGRGTPLAVSSLTSGTHTLTATVTDGGGRQASAEVVVVVNAPPVLTITAPASPLPVDPGGPLTLAALVTDLEDGDLAPAIAWSSNLDGALGTGGTVTVTTLRSGTHVVAAEVADSGGRTATASVTVVVDAPPVVAITAPTPGAVAAPGTIVTFAGTATDLEEGDLGDRIAWSSDLDGPLGVGRTLAVTTLRAGTHTVTAAVIDASGRGGFASVPVIVDTPPTIAIMAPAPGALLSPGATTLAATAHDAEDGDVGVSIAWTSSLDGSLGTGRTLTATLGQSGTYLITATVTDARGLQAVAQVSVTVNAIPTLAIATPPTGTVVTLGDTLVAAGTASDVEDGDLGAAIAWSSSLDGPLGTGATLAVSTLRAGTHQLTATGTDSGGRSSSTTTTVIVNAPPTLAIVTPTDGTTALAGQSVVLTAVASDLEDGDLGPTIAWTSSLDGPLGTGTPLARATLRPGTHLLTATVEDAHGVTASATTTLLVNVAPTAAIVTPAGRTVFAPGQAVTLAGIANDAEDGDLTAGIAWSSSLDGPLGTGGTLTVTSLRSGTHVVTATATDASGATASASVTVVVSSIPVVTITTPTTDTAFAPDEPVILAATASDGDDGDLTPGIAWTSSLDGPFGVGPMPSGSTLRVGVHTITASATDHDGQTTRATITITVAPQITLAGPYTTTYENNRLLSKTLIDARTATFFAGPTNLYPIALEGGAGITIRGGNVIGGYDRNLSWTEMHDMNNAAIAVDNAGVTVDGLRADNVEDGVRPRRGDVFTVRNVHLSYVRDDCIENDHVQTGLVDDSLFDGCYTAFSARPSAAIVDSGFDGSDKLWTIQNSLIRVQAMPGPSTPTPDNLAYGTFFKWHLWDNPSASLSPKLALHGNVFMADRVGQAGADRMGIPPGQLASCSNNVMVWLGSGPYPAPLPSCFTVTTDRAVWDAAVASWLARHPDVAP